ncbi:MAG TPA: CbiQ family ECF transporter T component [Arachnia sp.]|nr:CbiQ family ECF transporter T component [Arachnia sp.]
MNAHASLLGLYEPGEGWLFRLGTGVKYLLLVAVTVPPLMAGSWWVTTASLAAVLTLLWTSGVTPVRALRIGWVLWMLLAVMAGYHLISLNPTAAVVQSGNILVAVLAARMLTLTTSTPVLMDALARGLAPVRWLRIDPQQVALAVALMIRSVPYLIGSIDDARDAARARGRDRNPALLLTPVVVGAVAYAERTGEALHARGLPEDA